MVHYHTPRPTFSNLTKGISASAVTPKTSRLHHTVVQKTAACPHFPPHVTGTEATVTLSGLGGGPWHHDVVTASAAIRRRAERRQRGQSHAKQPECKYTSEPEHEATQGEASKPIKLQPRRCASSSITGRGMEYPSRIK